MSRQSPINRLPCQAPPKNKRAQANPATPPQAANNAASLNPRALPAASDGIDESSAPIALLIAKGRQPHSQGFKAPIKAPVAIAGMAPIG